MTERRTRLTPALIACVGVACATTANLTMQSEGKVNVVSYDPAHIPTVCWGHTGPEVKIGEFWSDGTCKDVFSKDQQREGIDAARCTPEAVIRNRYAFGAVVDFAFNGGGGGLYCRSSMARYFWAGQLRSGCSAFRRYQYAHDRNTGRVILLKGLRIRREREYQMCMTGQPGYSPATLDARLRSVK